MKASELPVIQQDGWRKIVMTLIDPLERRTEGASWCNRLITTVCSNRATLLTMAARCELHNTPGGLFVRSKMKRPLVSAFLSGCIAAGFVALVAYEYVPVSIAVALALAGFGFGYLGALRQRTSELRATNRPVQ